MSDASYNLDHLTELEAESIYVLREVAAQFDRPAILFSGGKDSIVVTHLAAKAFAQGASPCRLVHIDTGHNFPKRWSSVTTSSSAWAPASSSEVCKPPSTLAKSKRDRGQRQPQPTSNHHPHRHDRGASIRRVHRWGTPRRGEGPSQGAFFLPPRRFQPVGPQEPAFELWNLFNGKHAPGEHFQGVPLNNWTELDGGITSFVRTSPCLRCTTRTTACASAVQVKSLPIPSTST